MPASACRHHSVARLIAQLAQGVRCVFAFLRQVPGQPVQPRKIHRFARVAHYRQACSRFALFGNHDICIAAARSASVLRCALAWRNETVDWLMPGNLQTIIAFTVVRAMASRQTWRIQLRSATLD